MAQKLTAYAVLAMAGLLGGGSLLIFMLFLYGGSFDLIDLGLSETGVLTLDAGLSLAFFAQHSGMVRRSFRHQLQLFMPVSYHGAAYAVTSGIVLLVLVIFWQKSASTLVAFDGVAAWMLHGIFFLAIAGTVWGMWALGDVDVFGLNRVLAHLRGRQPSPGPVVIRGPYRWVRHPLYFFTLLMLWSCPDLSVDRLQFNILWTAWVVIGTVLEERDLVVNFGTAYTDYQRKVPMLVPWRLRPLDRA